MMMNRSIVICGSLAQRPAVAGHTWVFLQYLLGFKRLGWEVLFLDRLDQGMCVDAGGKPCGFEASENRRYFLHVMGEFGLQDSFSLDYNRQEQVLGVSRQEVLARTRRSPVLLNVMGYLDDDEILAAAQRRVFIDIDPGVGQMWQALGLADVFQGHDDFVTIAENIAQPYCPIPTCGLKWIPWRQPVVLDRWPQTPTESRDFTSIATWRGVYAPIEYEGKRYGQRVHEFRKFASLPRVTSGSFKLALDIDESDSQDRAMLEQNGWNLINPHDVARDPWVYQRFIQESFAEFSVAKSIVVETKSGWFSDRSICYLASGKPVIVQDTGIGRIFPLGEGLLTFSTLEEAAEAVKEVQRDYPRHSKAARRIAEEFFDSDIVLRQLLARLGVEKS